MLGAPSCHGQYFLVTPHGQTQERTFPTIHGALGPQPCHSCIMQVHRWDRMLRFLNMWDVRYPIHLFDGRKMNNWIYMDWINIVCRDIKSECWDSVNMWDVNCELSDPFIWWKKDGQLNLRWLNKKIYRDMKKYGGNVGARELESQRARESANGNVWHMDFKHICLFYRHWIIIIVRPTWAGLAKLLSWYE